MLSVEKIRGVRVSVSGCSDKYRKNFGKSAECGRIYVSLTSSKMPLLGNAQINLALRSLIRIFENPKSKRE